MFGSNRKSIRATEPDERHRATTVRTRYRDYCVLELNDMTAYSSHTATVGSTKLVPGSRIFTAGCSGWLSSVALSLSIASKAVDVT